MIFSIAIAAFCATFSGGLFAFYLKDRLHLILGFSAGAVIGVAFFDLMPEAIELIGSSSLRTPSYTLALVALGFATYLVIDRMVILHRHHDDVHDHEQSARGVWGAGTLSLHSFLDGLGIGLAFHVSPHMGWIVAAAVLTHDFSDGINTVSMITRNKGTRTRAMIWLMIDAIAPMAGIVSALFFSVSHASLGMLLAIFAGFFLYIGASDLLPESHHEHPRRWTTIATIGGMITLFLVIRCVA